MFSQKYYTKQRNSTNLLIDRQYGNIDSLVCRELQTSDQYIDRLELEFSLDGHNGCVNCLEWSEDGRILASGSDDLCVFLWDVFRRKKLMSFRTPHIGNMFSVKFLPKSQGNLIASCAADKCVYVFDLNRNKEPIWSCQCHRARVKRLATAPDCPFQFWSASEDGSILQFDIREPHNCNSGDKILLVNLLRMINLKAEAKCIAVNPRRPELLAVGANDGYARMYDRRLLKIDSWNADSRRSDGYNRMYRGASNYLPGSMPPRSMILDVNFPGLPKNAVTYFSPGQYFNRNPMLVSRDSKTVTYLTFNSDGNELLVNMGAEHVYLYDINNSNEPYFLNLPECDITANNEVDVNSAIGSAEAKLPGHTCLNILKKRVPKHVEVLKKMGNDFLENEKYLRAIDMYSEAILLAPECPILYLNRATAFMRRRFVGDVYAALRDCHTALRLDPTYIKAHFRLARALLDLGRTNDAEECLNELTRRFPGYETNHGVMMLKKDITEHKKSDNTNINIENNNNGINGNSVENNGSNSESDGNNAQRNRYQYLDILECEWGYRMNSKDYKQRFIGHCNCTTDIKEANFFGKFIVAGSDDGNFFLWDRKTCKIKSIYKADMAIVNCVQPHPNTCLLATSGIDHEIKIWSPLANVSDEKSNRAQYIDRIVDSNQHKMRNNDLFELNPTRTYCRSS